MLGSGSATTLLGPLTVRTVVCRHTHMAFHRTVDGVQVLNPGSVGSAASRIRATTSPLAGTLADQMVRLPAAEEAMCQFERQVAEQRRRSGR